MQWYGVILQDIVCSYINFTDVGFLLPAYKRRLFICYLQIFSFHCLQNLFSTEISLLRSFLKVCNRNVEKIALCGKHWKSTGRPSAYGEFRARFSHSRQYVPFGSSAYIIKTPLALHSVCLHNLQSMNHFHPLKSFCLWNNILHLKNGIPAFWGFQRNFSD